MARGYGVELFGVSVTTLEEVFLRVGRDHTEADVAADERLQQVGDRWQNLELKMGMGRMVAPEFDRPRNNIMVDP